MEITLDYLQKRPISYSSLKEFAKSPKHYLYYVSRPRKDPSPEMLLGSVVDCLLWTPDNFDTQFMVIPKINRSTKVGKVEYKKLMETSANKKLITEQVFNLAKRIVKELKGNENVMKVLNQVTQSQKEIRWTDEETGLPMIAFQDGSGDRIIAELKTAKCAELEQFTKDAYKLDYPLQCGMYTETDRNKSFFYIVTEKEEPFGISVFKASEEYIEFGRKKLRELLNEFKYCLDNNLFDKGYDYRWEHGYTYINPPAWAKLK